MYFYVAKSEWFSPMCDVHIGKAGPLNLDALGESRE